MDIEYQVYGDMPALLPQGIQTLYWEHSDGNKSIRINYKTSNNAVTSFNLMGIRYRHKVCEKWILDKTPIAKVLANLSLANFDPELFKTYESDILATYNAQTGQSIRPKSKRSLTSVLSFLKSK